jgi:hypothetical protein
MIMDPAGLGTKNDCAGEDQQQFTRPDQTAGSLIKCIILVQGSFITCEFVTIRRP